MPLRDFYSRGQVLWCRTCTGEIALARIDGINEETSTLKLRQTDDSVCEWPLDLVSEELADFLKGSYGAGRKRTEILAQWNMPEDSPSERRWAFSCFFRAPTPEAAQ